MKYIVPISFLPSLMLCSCLSGRHPSAVPEVPEPIVSPPAQVASPAEIHAAASGMAALIDSSRSSAVSITSVSAVSISDDMDQLRKRLSDSESDVVAMRSEIERSRSESKAFQSQAVLLRDARESERKAHAAAISAKDATIADRDRQLSGAYSWMFRVVSAVGVFFIVCGLYLLWRGPDKIEAAGAVVVGVLAIVLGGVLPSLSTASSQYGTLLATSGIAVVGGFSSYFVLRLARQAWIRNRQPATSPHPTPQPQAAP